MRKCVIWQISPSEFTLVSAVHLVSRTIAMQLTVFACVSAHTRLWELASGQPVSILKNVVACNEKMVEVEAWNHSQDGQRQFSAQSKDGLVVDFMASNSNEFHKLSEICISPPWVARNIHVGANAKRLSCFDSSSGHFLCYKLS